MSNQDKVLILIRGLPGSGKTSLVESLDGIHICADECWDYDYTVDERGWAAEGAHQAHMNCQHIVSAAMSEDLSPIAVHNTFTTLREMEPYLLMAQENGYRVHTVIVENRHGNESVHNVPEDTMQKMRRRFNVKL